MQILYFCSHKIWAILFTFYYLLIFSINRNLIYTRISWYFKVFLVFSHFSALVLEYGRIFDSLLKTQYYSFYLNPKSKLYFKCGPWKARKNPWKIAKKRKMTLNKPEFDFRKSLGTLETDIAINPSWGLTPFTLQRLDKESHYIKPNRRKHIRRILLNKNKLKKLKPQSVNVLIKHFFRSSYF